MPFVDRSGSPAKDPDDVRTVFWRTTGADKTARPHEQRADAGDDPVSQAEVGGTSPGAIEDQELMLDEYGLSHHGRCAARPDEPDEDRHEVQKQDGQVTHGPMLTS